MDVRDLQDPGWMYLKAALFLAIGSGSSALLISANPTALGILLLGLVIWSFCRAYYFAFYVVEKYIDPRFRFSGLLSVLTFLIRDRRRTHRSESQH